MTKPLVLVTGATGFIARHCIAELLRRGYPVRGTVRSLARGPEAVRAAIARAGAPPGGELAFAAADLLVEEGWDAAVAGCEFVLHLASPFPLRQPRNWDEVIVPAREGALRLLAAALRAGIRRVVLTSSVVAVMYGADGPRDRPYTEEDWTDPDRRDITAYAASKTLAERAAWEFVRTSPGAPQLAVINPAFVLGPALDPDLSTSHELLRFMGNGYFPVVPRVSFPVCDVRDVAAAHVTAMLAEEAAGERFIVSGGELSLLDIGRIVGLELPDLARKMPRHEIPDWVTRLAAVFDDRIAAALPELGARRRVSGAKLRRRLGVEPRPAQEAVRAAARSLRELKLI